MTECRLHTYLNETANKARIQLEVHMLTIESKLSQHLRRLSDDCSNIRERLDVGDLELHPELNFDRDDEIDVIERIPVRDLLTPRFHRQLDRVVEQQVAKNAGELGEYLLIGHPAALAQRCECSG